MDYKELKQAITSYSSRKLEERKIWYSTAADAYNKVRPRYHKDVITQVVNIAQLSFNSQIIEVGCGPATATLVFAQLGFSMLCLEPNPDFYQLAQQNCQQYPKVAIENTSFEEWTLETEFTGLRNKIEYDFGGNLELSYISAFHVAQKFQVVI